MTRAMQWLFPWPQVHTSAPVTRADIDRLADEATERHSRRIS